jgi:hypothetical protein
VALGHPLLHALASLTAVAQAAREWAPLRLRM